MTTRTNLELEDLLSMKGPQLHQLLETGTPPDPAALVDRQWLGSDLSMPWIGHKVLWQTFRKTFVRDEVRGDVRGWNVKLEQRGTRGRQVPRRNRDGSEKTFAHYRIRNGEKIDWPRGLRCSTYLDYTIAGSPFPENLAFTPIVSVNGDDNDLILGWEIFKVGPRLIAPSMYWAIRPDGPLAQIVDPPRRVGQ